MKFTSLNTKSIVSTIKFAIAMPLAICARPFKKDIWIVTERPAQARDNGYYFFKYLRKEQPNVKVYYIIDTKSNDYNKVKEYGNIIKFDSFKHYFYYCLSKTHVSSHIGGCKPSNSPICSRIKQPLRIKDVFLPHGVSYGVSKFCLQKYAKIDLFICSGKQEYENVLSNYGYSKSQVAYTGFPRLDGWHNINITKNQIVLMPTWRLWLAQNPNTIFTETTYFKAYNELINNHELHEFLINNKLNLIFYLHNDMRKYVNDFKANCKNIEIVYDDNKYDIQELLKTSALLITDYSSVHFDFAYMDKPVLYYQFDKNEFYEKQYANGIFDVEKDGFGEVAYNINSLINNLTEAYKNNFSVEEKYSKRMHNFYQLHDCNNCKRVYDEIINRM